MRWRAGQGTQARRRWSVGRAGERDRRRCISCRSAGPDRTAEIEATAGCGPARQRRNPVDVVQQQGFDSRCIGGAARQQQRGGAGNVRRCHRGPAEVAVGGARKRGQHLDARRSEMDRVCPVVREAGEPILIVGGRHGDDVRSRITRRIRWERHHCSLRRFPPPPQTACRSGSPG